MDTREVYLKQDESKAKTEKIGFAVYRNIYKLDNINNNMIERPESFRDERRDCTVRAMSLAANIPYDIVHEAMEKCGRKNCHGIVFLKIYPKLKILLNISMKQVRRKGTARKFIKDFPKGNYFCTKRGHAFSVIDGVSHDLFGKDSHIKRAWLVTKKTDC